MKNALWTKFHRFPLLIVVIITAFDQFTKFLIVKNVTLHKEKISVIENYFDIVHTTNKGAAWGIFDQYTWLLALISFIAATVMIILFRKLTEDKPVLCFAMALIIGGTIGNLIDRAFLGEVIDFLSVHWQNLKYFPAFNVADSAICIGVFIYMICSFNFFEKKKQS